MALKNTLASLTWLRIARFTQQSNALSNEFLKQYGLTAAQFDVLVQVAAGEPLTQQRLASQLLVSEGGTSRMLKRIEELGWIVRRKEWKTNWISLTNEGRNLLKDVYEAQLAFQSALFEDSLSDDEQKTLYDLMTKLQKHTAQKL
ncbi:MarR family winged helix-turn-helix transcriptional regulator [Kurthia massiliensis]|uniref:MarR family winged helix-turn-helix transcriptional regulator n=1 Tax=Kurthia massiliensis TaxID=1033739 RepID=UPI00028814C5